MGRHPKLLRRGETSSRASFQNISGGSVESGCPVNYRLKFPSAHKPRPAQGVAGNPVAVLAKGRIVKQTVSFIQRIF